MTPDDTQRLNETRDLVIRADSRLDDLECRVGQLERRDDEEAARPLAEARKSHADYTAGERSKLAASASRRWDVAKVFIGGIAAAVLGWVTSHANIWASTVWRWLREKGS